jgi:hypothetical protein
MAICEDAPCCGCCGTNLYGVNQSDSQLEIPYCEICGGSHSDFECPENMFGEEDDDGEDD